MLPMKVRVLGLKVALSSKVTQVTSADRPGRSCKGGAVLGQRRHPPIKQLTCTFFGLLQSYLHVVDSLSIPTPDPQYLLDLLRLRHWGESVLIVHL